MVLAIPFTCSPSKVHKTRPKPIVPFEPYADVIECEEDSGAARIVTGGGNEGAVQHAVGTLVVAAHGCRVQNITTIFSREADVADKAGNLCVSQQMTKRGISVPDIQKLCQSFEPTASAPDCLDHPWPIAPTQDEEPVRVY